MCEQRKFLIKQIQKISKDLKEKGLELNNENITKWINLNAKKHREING